MTGPQGRSLVASDYDEGLATCRDFLKRAGPQATQIYRDEFARVQRNAPAETFLHVLASFGLLGLLATELSIEPDDLE